MTNLKKIIDKAVRGKLVWEGIKILDAELQIGGDVWLQGEQHIFYIPLWEFIFSIPFLKAFFGKELILFDDEGQVIDEWEEWMDRAPGHCKKIAWQYHAQWLILAEDRIEYLRKFL